MYYLQKETPYFVIDRQKLDRNIAEFQSGMDRNRKPNRLAYSVKTNSLPWVLQYVREKGLLAEVVSDEEYQLCLACGYAEKDIVFNGPIKTKKRFLQAVDSGAYVNIDSDRELNWAEQEKLRGNRLGIRVNVPPGIFSPEDIDYSEDGFRFGFSEANGALGQALERMVGGRESRNIGLHLHCNSITRSRAVYRAIAGYAVYLAEKYRLAPEFVDIGGGFFGGVPGKPTAEDYFRDIAEEFEKTALLKKTLLIAEPGSAIIGSAADYVTSVIDVKDTGHARVVTTDGSRIHIDPLWKKKRYLFSLQAGTREKLPEKQIICGYTCMDHDRLMTLEDTTELKAGDRLIYHKVGAYTMTFGGPFIRYYPEVYAADDGGWLKIRKRMNVDEYMKIQSIPDLGSECAEATR